MVQFNKKRQMIRIIAIRLGRLWRTKMVIYLAKTNKKMKLITIWNQDVNQLAKTFTPQTQNRNVDHLEI